MLITENMIKVIKVKQYSSKYVNVILVNNIPICTVRGNKSTSDIIAFLQGYETDIKDGKIKKILELIKEEK